MFFFKFVFVLLRCVMKKAEQKLELNFFVNHDKTTKLENTKLKNSERKRKITQKELERFQIILCINT